MLGVVDSEGPDPQLLLPGLETGGVAETGDGELPVLHKVQSYQLEQGPPPLLGGLVQDLDVKPQVGGQVVAQGLAPGLGKQPVGVLHFSWGEGTSARQLGGPGGMTVGRQLLDLRQGPHRVQEAEGKVSLLLLEAKQAPKLSQVGSRSQHLGDVAKHHSALEGDGGHLAPALEQPGPVTGLKQQGNQVTEQEDVIVTRPEVKTKAKIQSLYCTYRQDPFFYPLPPSLILPRK